MSQDRYTSTVVIVVAIIAAVRLAREENITTPSPKIMFAILESVTLARMILKRVVG